MMVTEFLYLHITKELKEDMAEMLSGFQRKRKKEGCEIIKVKAWDYPSLLEVLC